MLAHTSGFKTAITNLGRDINVLIDYYAVTYNLETEDDKLIITQDNMELLTEETESQDPTSHLTNDDIISLNKNNLGELFRTYMKSFDLETTHRFNVGDKMIIKVGTSVDGEIEYLNYGLFYVYKRQYNEDKQTYTYTICDRMLFTMVKYDNSIAFGQYNVRTCYDLLSGILGTMCGFNLQDMYLDETLMVNYNKTIQIDTFDGIDVTCRDVLDMILQVNGCSLVIGFDEELEKDFICFKTISQSSVDTIDDDVLKNKNIKIGKKYGKLNSLLFTRSDELDNIERKDDASILSDGKTQYVIKDNLILDQENRADYIDNLFNVMNGLEYYTCDIDTIGLGYIEYLDRFTISANGNLYNTICLKNTSEISNGMNENYTTEELTGTAQTFENIGYDDKKASITMDKLKGQIVLKTDSDGKISQVRLDSSGDDGSLVEIGADNIKLEGYTTINDNFKIDNNGDMECNNATINGVIKGSLFKGNANDSVALQIGTDSQGYMSNDNSMELIYTNDNSKLFGIYGKFWNTNTRAVYFSSLASKIVFDGRFQAQGFDPDSLEEIKKDFERLPSGLDIIKNIDIYKYRYKEENEDIKKHIGLVIGDKYRYSKEITNNKNDGVDLYSFISVCCKAIQEQQEQIEELKKEIENLKGGNK